jgi:hypothetical protein
MNQRRNKSKKNGRIILWSFLARPVFEIEACHKFIEYINKNINNNCRICKYSF